MVKKLYKSYSISFESIASQPSFRPDLKYRRFWDFEKGVLYQSSKHIRLDRVLEEIEVSKIPKGDLNESHHIINISDQEPRKVILEDLEEVDAVGSAKNPLSEADIIISKLGLPKGYLFYNDKKKYPKLLGSSELIPYKIINDKFQPKFVAYLLCHPSVLKKYHSLESGKTPSHWRVNPNDILKTKIPSVDLEFQTSAIKKIIPIENEIRKIKAKKKSSLEIINEVFADYYGFDRNLWLSFGKGMTAGTQKSNVKDFKWYSKSFTSLATSSVLRFSTRFHNPKTREFVKILYTKPTRKAQTVIVELRKGIQPKYSESGNIPVIKIANMRNGHIDFSEAETIDEYFYNKVKSKAGVKKGDILICCTGKVSLGKIDYYIDNLDTILSVDSYIIRLNEKEYNPLFFIYFLRSILGAFQIERDYTGTTNQIHLYEPQISMFDLPDISIKEQEVLSKTIESKLKNQVVFDQQAKNKREKIWQIIEDAIPN
jgi:type I restriction enzyme S subunit